MNPQWFFNPVIIPLIASALIALGLLVIGLRLSRNRLGQLFTLLMACILIWIVSSAVALSALDMAFRLLIDDAAFIGIVFIPVLWLLMVLEFTGQTRTVQRFIPYLLIVPIATNLVIWTNTLHGAWRGVPALDTASAIFPITIYHYHWWFYTVHAPYSYALTGAGLLLLILSPSIQDGPYRSQGRLILLAGLLPTSTDLLYVLDITPIQHLNITPIVFSLAGIIMGWAVLQARFIRFSPIARDLVIENMEDLVIILDRWMRVLDLNPAACAAFHLERDTSIGQPLETLLPTYPHLSALIQMRTTSTDEVAITHTRTQQWYDLRVSPIYRRRGELSGRLVVMRNITERKGVEQERERLIEELNAYAYSVAHDIKSPLGAIAGYAEMIDLAVQQDSLDDLAEYGEMISLASYQTIRIVDNLLLLAQTRRQSEVHQQPLDMASILHSTLSRIQPSIQQSEAVIDMPESWPVALGYAGWVEEVWVNLIENALKYGGKPPRIQLGAAAQGRMVRFWVRDHGPGIPSDKQAQMFRPFEQLDMARSSGYGLGLSIVRRIVDRLGGEVGVESPADGGTRFTFTLPALSDPLV